MSDDQAALAALAAIERTTAIETARLDRAMLRLLAATQRLRSSPAEWPRLSVVAQLAIMVEEVLRMAQAPEADAPPTWPTLVGIDELAKGGMA